MENLNIPARSRFDRWVTTYAKESIPEIVESYYGCYRDSDWKSGDVPKLVMSLSFTDMIRDAYLAGWRDGTTK